MPAGGRGLRFFSVSARAFVEQTTQRRAGRAAGYPGFGDMLSTPGAAGAHDSDNHRQGQGSAGDRQFAIDGGGGYQSLAATGHHGPTAHRQRLRGEYRDAGRRCANAPRAGFRQVQPNHHRPGFDAGHGAKQFRGAKSDGCSTTVRWDRQPGPFAGLCQLPVSGSYRRHWRHHRAPRCAGAQRDRQPRSLHGQRLSDSGRCGGQWLRRTKYHAVAQAGRPRDRDAKCGDEPR